MVNQHLRRVIQRSEVLLLTRNKNTQISEGTPKVSVHQPLCYLLILFPTPSTSSVTQTLQNTAEDPKDPEPADLVDIHMKYAS